MDVLNICNILKHFKLYECFKNNILKTSQSFLDLFSNMIMTLTYFESRPDHYADNELDMHLIIPKVLATTTTSYGKCNKNINLSHWAIVFVF